MPELFIYAWSRAENYISQDMDTDKESTVYPVYPSTYSMLPHTGLTLSCCFKVPIQLFLSCASEKSLRSIMYFMSNNFAFVNGMIY